MSIETSHTQELDYSLIVLKHKGVMIRMLDKEVKAIKQHLEHLSTLLSKEGRSFEEEELLFPMDICLCFKHTYFGDLRVNYSPLTLNCDIHRKDAIIYNADIVKLFGQI